jgi:NAD(P)-dependent dehydrogenase (short-subunit alcohol dehydrogenase family)
MKTVLITGIGRGIGKALADRFLAEGYFVIGTTYSSKAVPAAATTANLKTYPLDLSSPDSIKKCADEIKKSGMKIDILIDNAGIMTDDDETILVPEKLRAALEVNLIGTADFTEHVLPALNKGGHIIFVSSAAGSIIDMDDVMSSHHPYFYPAYKVSKAALNMYARTLAARLTHERYAIIVSCVHPGWVRTSMGGDEAPTSPEEAASDIFKLATSQPETGQFWYKGKKHQW